MAIDMMDTWNAVSLSDVKTRPNRRGQRQNFGRGQKVEAEMPILRRRRHAKILVLRPAWRRPIWLHLDTMLNSKAKVIC